ncbi:MAG: DUF3131 domain-containing protein [Alteromonadales bacterium]|nr:DUF3131 domain-containing protein [Alteromonadales bacterium]
MSFDKALARATLLLTLCINCTQDAYANSENISFYGQRGIVVEIDEKTTDVEKLAHTKPLLPTFSNEAKNRNFSQVSQLSENEQLLAQKAHYYFTNNWHSETGLWSSVAGYNYSTVWDIASGIAGTLALEGLKLESTEVTKKKLQKTLNTLNTLPLYKNILPNREYNSKTAQPSGRLSKSKSHGNGWSALDIGRLLIWLKILQTVHPTFTNDIEQITNRWQLHKAIYKGSLYGTKLYKGKEYYRQEGRHGYLQYAAKGFELFDFKVNLPNLEDHLQTINIDNIEIKRDTRNLPFFTSDPFVLGAIELGVDTNWNQLNNIYLLHFNKWRETGILTSYGEDAMNKNPWFAYNNIYYYKKPWTSVSSSGKVIENPQLLSYKVAFAFSVLFDDEFSQRLNETVIHSSLQFKSVPTGRYQNEGSNSAFNINTNSLVLVSLWYKSLGFSPIYESVQAVKH